MALTFTATPSIVVLWKTSEADRCCPLETESAPAIYLYRLIMGEQEQIGVGGLLLD